MASICILIPAEDYEEDWSVLKADYERLFGDKLTFRRWTEPGDLSGFDLVSPLIAWGYQRDCPKWFALLDRLEAEDTRTCNPVSVLRWNTNKIYLRDLSDAEIPVVPTRIIDSLSEQDIKKAYDWACMDKLVIKPLVSGGADGTYLLNRGDPLPENAIGQHMLVQPFIPFIEREGELSLFYFAGQYSHAIVKHPAKGDFRVQEQFGGSEQKLEPPEDAKELAEQALATACNIHGIDTLAYARVDMISDWAGEYMLMELELIEPSLFLQHSDDGGAAFAKAILAAA